MLVSLDEDVVLGGRRQRFDAGEVGVDSQVLKEGVPTPCTRLPRQQGRLTAGVDHETGGDFTPALAVGDKPDGAGGAVFGFNAGNPVAFADPRPGLPGVVEEDLVELGTPDLEGVGVALAGLPEEPTPRLGVAAPDHSRAVLGQEARLPHRVERAQLFQHRNAGGQ